MKKILTIFFVVLGVVFFLLMLLATYFYVADPLNLKPLLFGNDTELSADTEVNVGVPTGIAPAPSDESSFLNEQQADALKTFGIDPETLPSEITPEQEACFVEKLGSARVAEIVAGDSPSVTEFYQARDCI